MSVVEAADAPQSLPWRPALAYAAAAPALVCLLVCLTQLVGRRAGAGPNASRRTARIALYLVVGVAVVFWFAVGPASAVGGRIDGNVYYLSNHGRLEGVSREEFRRELWMEMFLPAAPITIGTAMLLHLPLMSRHEWRLDRRQRLARLEKLDNWIAGRTGKM